MSLFTIRQYSRCLGWFPWERYLHWAYLSPPQLRSWVSSQMTQRAPGSKSHGSICTQWAEPGQPCGDYGDPNSHKQLSREWQVSSTQNALTPQARPLSAPNTLHIVLQIFLKENTFCISSRGEERTGKHSQKQQADDPSFYFRSRIFMIVWPGMHLFSIKKLSRHVKKTIFGSVCDPQSTNSLKLRVQRKFSATPPPTLKHIHLSGPKRLICHVFQQIMENCTWKESSQSFRAAEHHWYTLQCQRWNRHANKFH